MSDISVSELRKRMQEGHAPRIIDVREVHEYETDHIAAENIPMGQIPGIVGELADYKDKELVICCRSGGRSGQITNFLKAQGFSQVRNLTGGMLAWKAEIDPNFQV